MAEGGSGVLAFTLGLTTGNFVSSLAEAGSGLKEFLASMLSFEAVTEGVMNAIEKGAGLEALHKQTGASVQDLYQIQEGFRATGVTADNSSRTLLNMQRAIGGVNDMGAPTADVFNRIGLNIDAIRGMDAPHQIQAITGALHGLNSGAAAAAAEGIFGREGAQSMLQLANSSKEFAEGMSGAASEGAQWERVSASFEAIETAFSQIKQFGVNFFGGVAAGLVPALQTGLAYLNSMRDTIDNLGQKVGNLVAGVTEAFREGKIEELLQLSFAAAVEFLVNAIAGTLGSGGFWMGIFKIMAGNFIAMWGTIIQVVASIGEVLLASFDTAFQKLFEWIGKIPVLGDQLGLSGYTSETFSQNYQDERKKVAGMSVAGDVTKFGLGLSGSGVSSIGSAVGAAIKNAGGPAQTALKNFLTGLVQKSPALKKSADTTPTGAGSDLGQKSDYKPGFTKLEQMGFVMGGGSNPMMDFARRTAMATEKIASATGNKTGEPSTFGNGVNAV